MVYIGYFLFTLFLTYSRSDDEPHATKLCANALCSERLFTTTVEQAYASSHEGMLSYAPGDSITVYAVHLSDRSDLWEAQIGDKRGSVYSAHTNGVPYQKFLQDATSRRVSIVDRVSNNLIAEEILAMAIGRPKPRPNAEQQQPPNMQNDNPLRRRKSRTNQAVEDGHSEDPLSRSEYQAMLKDADEETITKLKNMLENKSDVAERTNLLQKALVLMETKGQSLKFAVGELDFLEDHGEMDGNLSETTGAPQPNTNENNDSSEEEDDDLDGLMDEDPDVDVPVRDTSAEEPEIASEDDKNDTESDDVETPPSDVEHVTALPPVQLEETTTVASDSLPTIQVATLAPMVEEPSTVAPTVEEPTTVAATIQPVKIIPVTVAPVVQVPAPEVTTSVPVTTTTQLPIVSPPSTTIASIIGMPPPPVAKVEPSMPPPVMPESTGRSSEPSIVSVSIPSTSSIKPEPVVTELPVAHTVIAATTQASLSSSTVGPSVPSNTQPQEQIIVPKTVTMASVLQGSRAPPVVATQPQVDPGQAAQPTGHGHSHDEHGHSHGGHGHSHGEDAAQKRAVEASAAVMAALLEDIPRGRPTPVMNTATLEGHGHSHGGHGHSHEGTAHGHSHEPRIATQVPSEPPQVVKVETLPNVQEMNHGHSHEGNSHSHDPPNQQQQAVHAGHGHSHGVDSHDHGHSHEPQGNQPEGGSDISTQGIGGVGEEMLTSTEAPSTSEPLVISPIDAIDVPELPRPAVGSFEDIRTEVTDEDGQEYCIKGSDCDRTPSAVHQAKENFQEDLGTSEKQLPPIESGPSFLERMTGCLVWFRDILNPVTRLVKYVLGELVSLLPSSMQSVISERELFVLMLSLLMFLVSVVKSFTLDSTDKANVIKSKQFSDLCERLKVAELEVNKLRSTASMSGGQSEELDKALQIERQLKMQFQEQVKQLKVERDQLKESNNFLENENVARTNDLTALQQKVESNQTEMSHLKSSLEAATLERRQTGDENVELKRTLEELKTRNDQFDLQVQQSNANVEVLEEQRMELTKAISDAKNALSDSNNCFDAMKINFDESQSNLATREKEIDGLKELLANLQLNYDSESSAQSATGNDWEVEGWDVEGDDNNSEEKQKQKKEKVEKFMDIAKLKAEMKELNAEKERVTSAYTTEAEAHRKLKIIMNDLKEEKESLETNHSKSEKQYLEMETRLNILTEYFNKKEAELQKQLGTQQVLYQQRQDQLGSTEEEMTSLKTETTQLREMNEELKREMQEIDRRNNKYRQEVDKHRHEQWRQNMQVERERDSLKHETVFLRNRLKEFGGPAPAVSPTSVKNLIKAAAVDATSNNSSDAELAALNRTSPLGGIRGSSPPFFMDVGGGMIPPPPDMYQNMVPPPFFEDFDMPPPRVLRGPSYRSSRRNKSRGRSRSRSADEYYSSGRDSRGGRSPRDYSGSRSPSVSPPRYSGRHKSRGRLSPDQGDDYDRYPQKNSGRRSTGTGYRSPRSDDDEHRPPPTDRPQSSRGPPPRISQAGVPPPGVRGPQPKPIGGRNKQERDDRDKYENRPRRS